MMQDPLRRAGLFALLSVQNTASATLPTATDNGQNTPIASLSVTIKQGRV